MWVKIINNVKTFIPLENNPQVLSRIASNLDISTLTFHDIYSTNPDDLADLPRPINALIFLCAAPIYHAARDTLATTLAPYTGYGASEPIIWARQTIGHACGLMAFLHCALNLDGGRHIPPGSKLDRLRQELIPLPPDARAKAIYDSMVLEEAHMDAAVRGSSSVPDPSEPNEFHFIAFVKDRANGKVWELNGGLPRPVERGQLSFSSSDSPKEDEEDLISKRGWELALADFFDVVKRGGVEGEMMSIVAVGSAE